MSQFQSQTAIGQYLLYISPKWRSYNTNIDLLRPSDGLEKPAKVDDNLLPEGAVRFGLLYCQIKFKIHVVIHYKLSQFPIETLKHPVFF